MFGGRGRRLTVPVLAVALVAASVTFMVARGPARADVTTPQPTGAGPSVAVVSGDFTGDGKADLAVTGSQFFTSVPMAASAGDGSFTTPAGTLSDTGWASWSSTPGVHVLTGDFNGDGKTDLAMMPPPGNPWWFTVPVAMSDGAGSFTVTNDSGLGDFVWNWAQIPGVQVVTGDFNGDGKTDIALVGAPWWTTIPVAFSNGDGSFRVVTGALSDTDWSAWSSVAGVHVLTGDFNKDGKTDLAMMPPPGNPWWSTIPVAFSGGDGSFTVTNTPELGDFVWNWAQVAGAQVISGDFNGDGKTDVALTGGQGWLSVPVAFGNGDGSFRVVNDWLPNFAFAAWATGETAHANTAQCVHAADFNGDGKTDIALGCANTGTPGVLTIPVALSVGDGSFTVTNDTVGGAAPDWRALTYLAQRDTQGWNVAGDFNGDGKADLAVVTSTQSGAGPAAVPVALSGGDGSFTLTAKQVPGLIENLDGMPGSGAFGGIIGPAGKCIDDGGGSNGAQVVLRTCNGTPGQAWAPQVYGAIIAQGKCLTAGRSGGAPAVAGTLVQLWHCAGVDRLQHWQLRGSQLYNPQSGLCLDAGSSTADGTPLQVWGCNGTAAQNWTLPAGSSLPVPNPDQGYDVAYQGPDGHLGHISPDGTATQSASVLAAGTSPALVGLLGGAWLSTFVSADRSYWIADPSGGQRQIDGFTAGTVPPGSSPSMAGELTGPRTGPWMGDVQAVTGLDWALAGPHGDAVRTAGQMLAGTSPSITAKGNGVFEEAFTAPGGKLWVQQFEVGVGDSGGHLVGGGLSLAPGTSPAIAAGLGPGLGSAWEIAVHGSDDHLWTVDAFGNNVQYPYLLKPGSGVAITALPTTGQYVVVFQAASDGLVYKKATGNGWLVPDGPVSLVGGGIGMAANSSPAVVLGNTGYEIAVHGDHDTVVITGPDNTSHDTGQAIATGTSPAIAGSSGSRPGAPELSPVTARDNSVTISWSDNSTNESQFVLQKRVTGDGNNGWADIYSTYSDEPAGTFLADEYQYTDFSTGPDAECYRVLATPVVAVGAASPGVSGERCTVRPDPGRFPQSVPLSADQWNTFSANHRPPAVNGAPVDDLSNIARDFNDGQELVNRGQTWGVDLDWNTGGSCWIFRGKGSGDQLLMGQALAMEVCDSHGNGTGQYLAYGSQTFGVDVVLQGSPSYEWHVIGDSAFRDNAATGPAESGFDLERGGAHALWNDQSRRYLVTGHQTFGVDLDWFDPSAPPPGGGITQPPAADPGVGALRVFNCDAAKHAVSVWVKDTTAGASFQKIGSLPYQGDPQTGGCAAKDSQPLPFTPAAQRSYLVVVTDSQQGGCPADDPSTPACVVESRSITGNPSGAIETTTVGVGTDRSPFAANGLK